MGSSTSKEKSKKNRKPDRVLFSQNDFFGNGEEFNTRVKLNQLSRSFFSNESQRSFEQNEVVFVRVVKQTKVSWAPCRIDCVHSDGTYDIEMIHPSSSSIKRWHTKVSGHDLRRQDSRASIRSSQLLLPQGEHESSLSSAGPAFTRRRGLSEWPSRSRSMPNVCLKRRFSCPEDSLLKPLSFINVPSGSDKLNLLTPGSDKLNILIPSPLGFYKQDNGFALSPPLSSNDRRNGKTSMVDSKSPELMQPTSSAIYTDRIFREEYLAHSEDFSPQLSRNDSDCSFNAIKIFGSCKSPSITLAQESKG